MLTGLHSGQTFTIQKWVIVGGVGVLLGVYVVVVSLFPTQQLPLLMFPVIAFFLALVIGNLRRVLLGCIILDCWFPIDAYLGFREEIGRLASIGGLNVSLTTLALAVLYGWWLAELLTRRQQLRRPVLRLSLPLLFFVFFAVLSLSAARAPQLSLFEIVMLVQMLLLVIYIIGTVRTPDDIRFIVIMMMIGLILQSLVMIGLYFVGHSIRVGPLLARIDHGVRVAGTLGSPNTAGGSLSLVLAPLFSLILNRDPRTSKRLAALAFGLGCIALILTLSRGGWIAFGLSMALLCLVASLRGWLPAKVIITFIAITAVVFLLTHEQILNRVEADDHGAAYSRVPLMRLAFRMIEDNPLVGIGVNNFGFRARIYSAELGGIWLSTVHNKYLLVWSETGIGGLAAFLTFLLVTIRRGWQAWQRQDPLLSPLALGLMAGVIGQMTHMFVDIFNDRPQVQALWFVAALITVIHVMIREERVCHPA